MSKTNQDKETASQMPEENSHLLNRLVKLITWITGKKPNNERKDYKMGNDMCIRQYPAPIWRFAPTGDFYSLTIEIHKAPNFIHRFMQRLIFGMKYQLNQRDKQ